MGIFNNMFGKNEKKSSTKQHKTFVNWIPLKSIEELDNISKNSESEAILVFKHSTRCGISSMVIKQFEKMFTDEHQHLKVYYLDLLNYRDISDEVGFRFQVMHQSPQLIVVRNGVSVHHASHHDILQTNLSRFI